MKKQLTQLFALISLNIFLISSFSVLFNPNSALAQVPDYVPINGLVGWWPFNGNANDESGNGNNGTVNGASLSEDRFGNVNKAYFFNGSSNSIVVPHSFSIGNSIDTSLTISVWAKIDGLPYGFAPLVSKNGPQFHQYEFFVQDVEMGFWTTNIYCDAIWSGGTINNNGNWHHFAVTFSSDAISIYKNGNVVHVCYIQSGTTQPYSNSPLEFGMDSPNGVQYLQGKLDDIGIWNRTLTSCEIKNLYNADLNWLNTSAGLDQTICKGESTVLTGSGAVSYVWNNNVIDGQAFIPTSTSSYIVTGTDANGCSGQDTVVVFVNELSSSTQTQTALDSYTWPVNGQTYTQSGQYTDTLTNAAGCDSIITLDLTLSFTGIEELNANPTKKLVKITDLNGKETPFRKNTVLLFIYEDGTVERVYDAE